MRKLWLMIPLVLVAVVWLYGCDKASNPLEAATTATGETALFAAGPKPKAQPNPIGCAQDEVAKWDETSGAWVCAADLQGATGPQPALLSGYEVVVASGNGAQGYVNATVSCPTGKKPITGGHSLKTQAGELIHSHPTSDGWSVRAWNNSTSNNELVKAWAACVDVMPTS